MSKKAFERIRAGLEEAISIARGETAVEVVRYGCDGAVVLRPVKTADLPDRCG